MVLFLRPAELVPSLIGLPIYECVILLAIAASFPRMVNKLQVEHLRANPINLCVLGVLVAVPLSHLRHMDFWDARYSFMQFGKTALYYLLFIAVVSNARRLDRFLRVLVLLLAFMTGLSLLNHHEFIDLPQLNSLEQRGTDADTGEITFIPRLQSTGIFNDPNDFAMILAIGIMLGASFLLDGNMLSRPIWLTFIAAFLYAMVLTKSRGGFLALFAAMGFLAYSRWGWKRAVMTAALMLPLVAAVFAMRDDGGMESGTGQSRIQLWSEGFELWKHVPMFGIGYGMYNEEVGQVAHNSFLHCYVELGLFGGTLFFGCFYFALRTLWTQRTQPEVFEDPTTCRRTTLAIGIIVSAAVSMLTLSRAYEVPVYTILGIGAIAAEFNDRRAPFTLPRFDYSIARKWVVASLLFVSATYIYMKTMVHWG